MRKSVNVFSARLEKAIRIFHSAEMPLWKRTRQGVLCFQGLEINHLPSRLREDIDTRFGAINQVLSGYTINSDDDYEQVSAEDLIEIQRLIGGFAFEA